MGEGLAVIVVSLAETVVSLAVIVVSLAVIVVSLAVIVVNPAVIVVSPVVTTVSPVVTAVSLAVTVVNPAVILASPVVTAVSRGGVSPQPQRQRTNSASSTARGLEPLGVEAAAEHRDPPRWAGDAAWTSPSGVRWMDLSTKLPSRPADGAGW